MAKLENVLIGLAVGGIIGGLAGGIVAQLPPLTLPEEQTSLGLNQSDQGFGVLVGILIGETAGGIIALAAD